MNSEKLRALRWHRRIGLRDGIADTYRVFLEVTDGPVSG
jgi:hypothetical protein